MERLQNLLIEYNTSHQSNFDENEWALQFCEDNFPLYWKIVFSIAQKLPQNSNIIEIGACYGFITAIFIYLKMLNIKGYESNKVLAEQGNTLLYKMFGTKNIILPEKYKYQQENANVLVIVNCAYAEGCNTKAQYMEHLKKYYSSCGQPKHLILEVIDSSYKEVDDEIPLIIRLSKNDIKKMFPNCRIQTWETYKFPKNKKSKTLYLIEAI